MALVTIGVPVYNGGELIGECLECLVRQTFQDIDILVFDNASTDGTQAIVEAFAAKDQRIKYIRRPENIGAIANFLEPLDQATSPFFMWRAHDDLSDLDYVEKLCAALQANPQACLATGTVENIRLHSQRPRRVLAPHLPRRTLPALEIAQLLFGSHAGWYYGLWRTRALRPLVHRVWTEFPHAWASDHLTLYPLLLDRAVAAVPQTRFIQRMVRKEYTPAIGHRIPLAELVSMRESFWHSCCGFLAERNFSLLTRLALRLLTWVYLGKRVYKARTVARVSLLAWLNHPVNAAKTVDEVGHLNPA